MGLVYLLRVRFELGINMIEAVNSVLSNASLLRQGAEQQSAVRSFAANPERVQEVIQAPYVDAIGFVPEYDKAILFLRDSETGDPVAQIPSERGLELRRRQEVARQADIQDAQSRNEVARQKNNADITVQIQQAPGSQSSAPVQNAPITQAVLSAFASGAQAGQSTQSAGVNVSA